jgi:hydrogenase large subunit
MATIKIVDPVTRIEGHMKIEIKIENNEILDARCSGTLFRGFETILVGRAPWDASVITQRICGVCPISHALASVLALDDAAGRTPPANARILRNLTLGANFIQSHILHFYLLAAPDYVKGPQVSPWIPAWDVDLRPGLDQISEHLATNALAARRKAHEMGAIFGGKMPAAHAIIPGGFTGTPTEERIDLFLQYLEWLTDFIQNTYIPDVNLLTQVYQDHLSVGKGFGNLMAFGVFKEDDEGQDRLFAGGYIEAGQNVPPPKPKKPKGPRIEGANDGVSSISVKPLGESDSASITESVTFSWYEDSTNGLTPADGVTKPLYPKNNAYSWLKAPRLHGKPFEVGPLARLKVNGLYSGGVSVMDRHLARANETLIIVTAMERWLQELAPGEPVFDGYQSVTDGFGVGMSEAPRGALGHWIEISAGKISHYQIITPTCWNASPGDEQDIPGPMEQALIGTPVRDPERPIEALRVIHSFDPCLSCAVHVMKPKRKPHVIKPAPQLRAFPTGASL